MAFQSPYKANNFIGLHADGATATAWIKAVKWDTTQDGLGDPQEGMTFYNTTTHQLYYWDGSTWINHSGEIEGGIYVDATYGSDVSGDGTISKPYQSLLFACSVQPTPTTYDIFMTPLNFYLAPGNYISATVVLPERMSISILGRNCAISASIDWPINPELWATYGLSAIQDLPRLNLIKTDSMYSAEETQANMDAMLGFNLIGSTGTLRAYNSNPGTGNPVPTHILALNGVTRYEYNIYNEPSGTAIATDAVNDMALFLRDSGVYGTSLIGGEADHDAGAAFITPNEVIISATRSDVEMFGTCKILLLENCNYSGDYRLDHDSNAYAYGRIHGSFGQTNVRRCSLLGELVSGFDPLAPDTPHVSVEAIGFDRSSLVDLYSNNLVAMATAFYGYDSILSIDTGFGRGWFFEESGFNGEKVKIPIGNNSAGAWNLFVHAYVHASDQRPNGNVLAALNRYSIELEAGQYELGSDFEFDAEFVDVIGIGSDSALGLTTVYNPTVVIQEYEYELSWSSDTGSLHRCMLLQSAGVGVTTQCLLMKASATYASFRNLVFAKTPTSVGTVYAVVADPALHPAPVVGSWEDCRTELSGFLYGGNFASICIKCIAGGYSFGGWNGAAPLNITVQGAYMDCRAGWHSFAASQIGGDVTFNATAERCVSVTYSFGCTRGGVGADAAVCNGTLKDCTSGESSFGYSTTGNATASGSFDRCVSGRRSFGCSAIATGIGLFSGIAIDCQSGYRDDCFGANTADRTQAGFSGVADKCTAGSRSFGARGRFSGQARLCKAYGSSFGDTLAVAASALMDSCWCTGILGTAGNGPPGIYGGIVRNCFFSVANGHVIEPLRINGGSVVGGDESRVFGCDLYTRDGASSVYAAAAVDAQIAHCRMNIDIDVNVTNVIAAPNNVLDAGYRPI